MNFTVAQRNAGVDYVKQQIAAVESKLSGFEKSFIPKFTDVDLLSQVDKFLAAVANAK
jgi:hypothetical protein